MNQRKGLSSKNESASEDDLMKMSLSELSIHNAESRIDDKIVSFREYSPERSLSRTSKRSPSRERRSPSRTPTRNTPTPTQSQTSEQRLLLSSVHRELSGLSHDLKAKHARIKQMEEELNRKEKALVAKESEINTIVRLSVSASLKQRDAVPFINVRI
jgi:hypothetical protein